MIMDAKKGIKPDGTRPDQFDTGSMLREWRVLNGLTQEQVARKAGITQQQYQRFESGSRDLRRCSFQIACQVLEALDIDIVKFYHGQNKGIPLPTFLEGEPLPPGYNDPPNPYMSPPPCYVDLLALSKYAKSIGKKITDLTKEEVQLFSTKA